MLLMGKKARAKHRVSELVAKKKPVSADDYFSHGAFEMARFGTLLVARNRMSGEQFEEAQEKLIEHFPEVCQEINDAIFRIVEIVRKLPPDEVLKRGYWEMAGHHLNIKSESDIDQDGALSLRMVDYLQSIIASAQPAEVIEEAVTEEQWEETRALVGGLFSKLNMDYQICRTAVARKNDPDYDPDFEEYFYKAQIYWCNIRGHRYSAHNIPFLRDVLSPHNDILQELFGINVEKLLSALQRIQDSLTMGLGNVLEELVKCREVVIAKLEEKRGTLGNDQEGDLPDAMRRIIRENYGEDWREHVSGRLCGLDLFNLAKITDLPEALLNELSWEPGQDTEFFAEGEYKAWPLRIWPIFKRPFIKINGQNYCFELYNLFDNFYRTMQRIILKRKPEYRAIWNNKQQDVSERIPIELFVKLLPGAQTYRPVYYRWHTGSGNSLQWCEVDAILIYEDHLFIVEVKAGAFTYTPPATDFSAYIESLRNLVFKPAEQGGRFLEYLESDVKVDLFDKNHDFIGTIARNEFEHVTVCAVTLDAFTELASQAQHLKKIGVNVGQYPQWSISIDDLRVYTDIFDNPLIFLHFVEQRVRAFQSNLIKTEDELDHLGLYLKHNIYTEYVKQFGFDRELLWNGYRVDIDHYFTHKLHDPDATCSLRQELPVRLKEIIDFLSTSTQSYRRKVSSMLLDCEGSWRTTIWSGIDEVLKEQSVSGRARALSTYGDVKITVFCWQEQLLERDKRLALEHVQTAMLVTGDQERLLVELTFNLARDLIAVDFDFISLEDIPDAKLERLKIRAESLRRKRIEKAMQNRGGIGRNDPCPCGSGKKYKKCCLP